MCDLSNESSNRRILVIDDNKAIHDDFRKILVGNTGNVDAGSSYADFFGETKEESDNLSFEVDSAFQGQEGLAKVKESIQSGQPYAMAFVDIRMPPGWDGVETIGHLWKADPNLLIVICTAYNDYDWSEMSKKLGHQDRWLILKKPFDNVEVRQLSASLTEKWELSKKANLNLDQLQKSVDATNRRLTAFRDAVDVAGIVAVTDASGRILEVNDNFCNVSGYARDELIGQNHRIVRSGHHPKGFFKEMFATIGRGNIWRGEVCNRSKDGGQYWVDSTIVPMFNENKKIESYFALRLEISDRKELMERLRSDAYHDALTGLPNRASILESIQNTIDSESNQPFALLFLDFDRFKLINDTLGHDMGDELLREIACRLRSELQEVENAEFARLGGDEFVVLLNGLSVHSDAIAITERLLKVFSKSYQLGPHAVYSTASIGVVTSDCHRESACDMLRDADLAMYEAKAAGRGCYAIFDQTLLAKANSRISMENALRKAITQDEFTLFYQPVVSLESGKATGVEASVRWIHPQRNLLHPNDFISVAEEAGLIVPIGRWMLDEACRQFSQWRRLLGANSLPCIHVSVSRKQLLLPDLIQIVTDVLSKHDIPPECLYLSVTESTIMHDQKIAVMMLRRLRELGVKIELGEFGKGYTSLTCLHEFPIDVVKIDRSFVENTKRLHDYAAILQAILTLADNLDLQVISEGIDEPEQLALLQALGCEYGQGNLFSKPVSASEIENYIAPKKSRNANLSKLPLSGLSVETSSDIFSHVDQ